MYSIAANLIHLEPASLPVPNPTRPFWLDPPEVNVLAKEGSTGELTQDADVCIIGSGITGISAAYHLVNRLKGGGVDLNTKGPIKIVVLEARDFCEWLLPFVSSISTVPESALSLPYDDDRLWCYG